METRKGLKMLFLGTLFGADELSVPITPTSNAHEKHVTLHNGAFDKLYITKDTSKPIENTDPSEWNWDTILYADYNGTTKAGNLLVSIDAISNLVIKRKRTDEFKWITIDAKEIKHDPDMTPEELVAQMDMRGTDMTATIGYDYEYAAVPVLDGMESVYAIAVDKCESDGIVILDKDEVWMTIFTDGNLDTTAVVPNAVIESMWEKYPTIIRNTNANYETIQVTASFVPGMDDCSTDWNDEVKMMQWNRKAYDFLRNDKPKILKATDGRIWLVYVSTPPTDAYDESTEMRKLTFTCTEIGDINSEPDLYDAGFINAGEEWWN